MKPILYSVCIGSLALAFTAQGAQVSDTTNNRGKGKHRNASVQTTASANTSAAVRTHHNNSGAQLHRSSTSVHTNVKSNAVVNQNHHARTVHTQSVSRNNTARLHHSNVVHHDRNLTVNRERNVTVNRERNIINRERNITINNNWRGDRFNGRSYLAFRNYHRQWHDRGWWVSHYPRITFYFGSPYYWDSGYWYPAWGYAPNAYYSYDGPIYGYNNLSPDRVVVDVQEQLARDGYYAGPIDGQLGPMTRRALTAFQADHGLAITSAIDEPTLETLGVS